MRKTNLLISFQGLGMAISLMLLFLVTALWYLAFIPLFVTLLVGLVLIIGPSMPKKGKGAAENELQKAKMQMLLTGAIDLITFALLLVLAILLLL
jgi:hypothetical protein